MKKILLAGVAALLLVTGAAHAGQRNHVVVRQIMIPSGLLPPPKYDKPYNGELEIRLFSNVADVQQVCINSHSDTGCTMLSADHKHCWIFLASEDILKRKGRNYAFVLRHELAHCNDWKHPNTTEGKKFNLGDTWDKAEGAKWIAANTKMPMPKFPASTRILPAPPPVVCVTPDWKPEPCASRAIMMSKLPEVSTSMASPRPNTETEEGLRRWCSEHPKTVASECEIEK
jgi:hypothetical protein